MQDRKNPRRRSARRPLRTSLKIQSLKAKSEKLAYQISHLSAAGRTMGSPSLQLKAF